jgi:S1-C subfamily serine protease
MDIVDPTDVQDGQQVWVITRRLQTVTITPERLRSIGVASWQTCEQYHATWQLSGTWADSVGGAVVNEKGRLLGLLGSNGTIIPADMIQPVLDRVLQQNDATRPGCGFRITASGDILVSKTSTPNFWLVGAKGADAAVIGKGPADTAGLKSGDRIVKVDGSSVPTDPGAFFRSLKIGQSVKLEILRGTTKQTVTLKTSSVAP